ncbi:PQQ-dependent sugar dehydrogenase [Pseudalkalibacillus berkeleyi]|uniref:PQQ-dependent sugar dehydrogenase n=1 Tax=Pseudalkalibacillus berkeleyi TaxID=1069813 RepID=A0ABS9H412_9BACL|nr:PQQ-dependent sugar dehydrogenase [Pseudalkalibacillus berkeleyi]MCF6138577.1 PQQ-dependent sugar dehydrogenase [Pseudalkalibacillus berkeleyi]
MALGLMGCSSNQEDNHDTSEYKGTSKPAYEENRQDAEILATKLKVPWQINVINDTVFYLSGRTGEVYSIKGDSKQKQKINLSEKVVARTEGGLLGFLILEQQSEPLEAIVYHTYQKDGKLLNRVVRVQKEESVWLETSVLLENIPGGPIHNGGRIALGPDGFLYITTGDAGNKALSQDSKSLAGKILRIQLDGKIPADNPIAESPIYSIGHRNPQGLGWDSDGTMYSSEHGSRGHDEINKIVPGGNYGWPNIQGDEEQEGMIRPVFHSGNETWAPSGLDISGSKIYVAALAGEQIRVFDLKKGTHSVWKDGYGRMRDVKIVDEYLYTVTNNTDGRGKPKKNDDRLLRFKVN